MGLKLEQLELELIRCAEREPERIGNQDNFFYMRFGTHGNKQDACILGQVALNLGIEFGDVVGASKLFYVGSEDSIHDLASRAAELNNNGVKWGEIPKRLGIVPGESPIPEIEKLDEATV